MKIGGEKVRGFALDQFVDTFARYLAPDVPDSTRYPGTDSSDAAHRSTGVPGDGAATEPAANENLGGDGQFPCGTPAMPATSPFGTWPTDSSTEGRLPSGTVRTGSHRRHERA